MRNVTTPMGSGPESVSGKLTVREARFPSGCRTTQEANAGGRKETGNRGKMVGSSVDRSGITGRIRALPEPERVLTWVG